jgi:hypothetical protein
MHGKRAIFKYNLFYFWHCKANRNFLIFLHFCKQSSVGQPKRDYW